MAEQRPSETFDEAVELVHRAFCYPDELVGEWDRSMADALTRGGYAIVRLPPDERQLRDAAAHNPWSFKEGTLRERLEWARMQHQLAAESRAPVPQRTPDENAAWHWDCVRWYEQMVHDLDAPPSAPPLQRTYIERIHDAKDRLLAERLPSAPAALDVERLMLAFERADASGAWAGHDPDVRYRRFCEAIAAEYARLTEGAEHD